MDEEIYIEMVSSDEAYEWLNDMVQTLEGHDRDVIGTIALMLEDLTEFVNKNEFMKKHFMQFIEDKHDSEELLH